MSKQRPSDGPPDPHGLAPPESSRHPGTGWAGRIFKNTYTRDGRQIRVKGWSVKIQFRGTRRTFSLSAKTGAAARVEAQALHQTIVTQGWDAIHPRPTGARTPGRPGSGAEPDWPKTDARHWRQRLLRRPHSRPAGSVAPGELSVRIDHAGHGRYFPLHTTDPAAGAARAREVYVAVVREGWEQARRTHACEMTLALHWTDDPLAWTYSTLHTCVSDGLERIPSRRQRDRLGKTVLVVEPDPTIRHALAGCVQQQEGFVCLGSCETAAGAIAAMSRHPPDLVLTSHVLPLLATARAGESGRRAGDESLVVQYSVHEDSDQLFKATPGGASGYLLKRTPPDRLFEPILDAPPDTRLTTEHVTTFVRRYFQKLLQRLSPSESGREMAKLTHREHEILNLLSRGCVDKEIADALRISIWTVHGHLKRIYEKLGVHTRTEAAIRYLQK